MTVTVKKVLIFKLKLSTLFWNSQFFYTGRPRCLARFKIFTCENDVPLKDLSQKTRQK